MTCVTLIIMNIFKVSPVGGDLEGVVKAFNPYPNPFPYWERAFMT
jgi:hypothetical protein